VILGHIREAMSAHSILLINESLLPESKVSLYSASTDMIMMANFSALERTEMQWRALLEKAGFDVVKIWTPDDMGPGSAGLIEAVLKM
jgi:O-methyltransferase domain